MGNIEEELMSLPLQISRRVTKILFDLRKVEGFEVYTINKWSSNLPDILPIIGNKMEIEIRDYINGLLIILDDQTLRLKWSSLDLNPNNKQ